MHAVERSLEWGQIRDEWQLGTCPLTLTLFHLNSPAPVPPSIPPPPLLNHPTVILHLINHWTT